MISRFSVLLLFVPALGMLSLCVTEAQAEQSALRAGAAIIDITPEPGVSLDGARIELDRRAHAAYYRHMPNETSAPAEAITLINRLNQYSVVGRQGAPNLRQPAQPRAAATVAAELSVAHRSLQTLLDERWRQFLALPGTGQQGQVRVTLEQWQTALDRFNEVARNPSFINLNQRQEFLSTHKLLQEYVEGMRPKTGRVSLPPPPNLTR